ncbi:dihydrodipicolinate synthase family protein [Microbacterium capsulatum]|uniref:Dihydrodipicolinate synthase family protein n=1 Tax=Microbacterium capsulatum TaxID=3041921 RepID=A0ABU0XDE4_9MICO|nr:dihydrodipicolinate synthase family protein [Microbacterium sp. ASV81]MDQ4213103.1 dihydrodipicolinate synthase family protein [Microbacterium sp. ASV81]
MTNASIDRYQGIIPPVLTPRTADGRIDVESLRRVTAHLVDGGVDGLFVLGSSGEVPYLTTGERDLVVTTVIDEAAGRVPVLAGANEQTTARVVAEAERLHGLGIDALVVTTPYYALSNQAEVAEHFRTVRSRVDLPLFAYDVPVRTHLKLSSAVIRELAEDGVIAGLKDSSGDDVAFRLTTLATADLPEFRVFTGHEVVVDGALLGGADGAVPGLANVDPAGYARLFAAAVAGDWEAARREQDRLARLFRIVEVVDPQVSAGAAGLGAFKTALQLLGVIESNRMSAPMRSLGGVDADRIRGILDEAGL